ncbi:hypothetical protein PVAND_014040 [Polypedilum vanderplanki]|uniref:Uncharacterized protein n=1 Tax=Polypedilum vanderplanki TaxID=319348 RepID=A0A9J6CSF9_POLVA|nr:hypothetical protein PVAND_014040 [Polypedilum vanderplanki]
MCRTISKSRFNGTFYYNTTLLKKVTKVKVSVKMLYRSENARNFHQLFKFDYDNICDALKTGKSGKNIILEYCLEIYPHICKPCPFLPGVYAFNYTMESKNCPNVTNSRIPVFSGFQWPDGDYKLLVEYYLNDDPFRHFLSAYIRNNMGDKNTF